MPLKPRLVDLMPRKREPRPLVTHDGTTIVRGESYPVELAPLALDERPDRPRHSVTFDGAMPSRKA